MPLLLRNLVLDLDESADALPDRAARRLKLRRDQIAFYALVRRAIDARGGQVRIVCNVELSLRDGPQRERRLTRRLHRTDVSLLEPKSLPAVRVAKKNGPLPAARCNSLHNAAST